MTNTPKPFPLKRNLDGLQAEFDVLVIGGGIYGAWTAYDAALRGLTQAAPHPAGASRTLAGCGAPRLSRPTAADRTG